MKSVLVSILTVWFLALLVPAQEMDMEEAMKLAQPGPPHEMLKTLEGSFDISFKYWMDLTGEPISGTGTAENKMILGGRFLESKSITGVMGQEMESIQIFGYDNRIKKHTYYGIDEWGTYSISGDGDLDENTKVITYAGTDSVSSPGMQMNYKFLMNMSPENGYIQEVHFQGPDGNYNKVVEVVHTRK